MSYAVKMINVIATNSQAYNSPAELRLAILFETGQ
jgi:hypothetical protein